jgi:MFS family permease
MLLFLWGPLYILFGLGSPALLGWLTLLNALLGVSWAFISTASTLFLVRLVGRSARGRALGLYSAVAGAGGLIGTLLGGWLYATYGVHLAYSIGAFRVIGGGLLLLPIPYHMFQMSHAGAHRHPLARSTRATVPPPPRVPRRTH